MLDTAILAFTTLFATIGPLDVAAMFAVLTAKDSARARRRTALRSTFVATIVLLLFALLGEVILRSLGISIAALRIGGGILLLLIGIDMAFAVSSGATSTTDEETKEAATRQDIAVFPLATPLIAGPGAMGAVILLMAGTEGVLLLQLTVIGTLLLMLLLTLVSMLLATHLYRLLGVTGMHVISRVMGVLLSALAVQFILDGIAQSGLLGS
jgi:multiple antibiotic resistance protein